MGWTAIEAASVEISVDALAAHGPVLLAAVRIITLDDDEAADIVQATFEIAIRRLHTLRDPAALRAWLLRIATREPFRVVRRGPARPARPLLPGHGDPCRQPLRLPRRCLSREHGVDPRAARPFGGRPLVLRVRAYDQPCPWSSSFCADALLVEAWVPAPGAIPADPVRWIPIALRQREGRAIKKVGGLGQDRGSARSRRRP